MMATVTQVQLTCDVCGDVKDIQTRTFELDGKTYEIELCPKDSNGLSKAAADYISKARKVTETARAPDMQIPNRGRATGSRQDKAKTTRSQQRAHKASEAKAKAANSKEKANTRHSGQRESGPQETEAAAKQAAKPTSVQQEKGIYVYGILPADIEIAAEMPGVGEHPGLLRVVRSNGLAALISEVDRSGRLGSPDDLRTHMEILDATATEVPVLPLRFGTVLGSEDAVAEELLAARHDEFADALEKLQGRAEFLVKCRYLEEVSTAKREEDTRALGEAMQGHCVASVVREPAHELDAVHVAFLVDAGEEREVERVIDDLARDWEGRIEVQLLGPMAAYDFAGTAKPEG